MRTPRANRHPAPAPNLPAAGSARAAGTVLDVLGLVLFALGLWSLARGVKGALIDSYDEGILLTNPMLLLAGKVPYRDFYSNYPPGLFWLIAGLWKLVGVHASVVRYLGLALHVLIALLVGRIGGQIVGPVAALTSRRAFSPLAAGLSMAWLSFLGNLPYAWLASLGCLLAFIALASQAVISHRRGTWLAAGACLGAAGCFRHDLFIYFAIGLMALAVGWIVFRRRIRSAPEVWHAAGWTLLAALVVLSVLWIPTLAQAGFARVAADLYFDQVRYVLPGRVLPFPALGALLPTPHGPTLPALAGQPFEGAVLLTLAGPVLAVIALMLRWRAQHRLSLPLVLVALLSVAVMPQMLGRTDVSHALYCITPALLLGAVLAETLAGRSLVGAALVALALALPVAFHLTLAVGPRPPPNLPPRYDGLNDFRKPTLHAARQEVFAFIDQHSRPGDPLYVGVWDHRWSSDSEIDLYFLADRVGATRYMQFDPNLVNRADVQAEMIRELETTRPKVAVLSILTTEREPNESTRPGAALLDAYLRQHYERVKQVERYILLLRR